MTVTIGDLTFSRVVYDGDADVLYLTMGDEPVEATETYATPEGHAVRYGEDGTVVGVTLVNPQWLLDTEGDVVVSLPSRLPADLLEPALTATS
jgi:uncharacterized protein YuzE